ncbi:MULTISPECIES: hypothetical protein [Nocardiaceae]|uniref:Uncharacterized protein n=1 Tax=Rhodococcoides kroppenstedtii TaxID=293050 RepID=A0ABS7NYZ8_9NOCA|nr:MULTISPECIES: hypothetical protein [Rhodococcus]MBY6315183.1 hypothetical protein [Rhodococcus kroppenstedtii]MBY6322793.1 hypothetical protein [Rhodococcus kroppenstedtii]MBY6401516.1 hypothetical protein [Rhodococcus kroppenstedtii]MBY6438567.1 hypothetical protein [Rhodococcus kroppenstedtii]
MGRFRARLDLDSLTARTNRQRTSTRGGTTKAHATLEHIDIFRSAGIDTIDHDRAVMADATAIVHELFDRINDAPGRRLRTTAWEVDHAIWQAGRALSPRRRR